MKTWVNYIAATSLLLCSFNVLSANVPVVDAETVDNTLSGENLNVAPGAPRPPVVGVVPQAATGQQMQQALSAPTTLPSKSLNMGSQGNSSIFLLNRLEELEKEIQSLNGQVEVQNHKIASLEAKVKAGGGSVQADASAAPKTALKFPTYFKQGSQAKNNAGVSDEKSYLQAYELIKRKEFPKAITALKGFIQSYPKSSYLANAYYWLGELYLAQGALNESLTSFDTVVRNFPMSNKAAGAMLKKGFVFFEKGDITQARTQLNEVRTKYPDTSLSRLASAKLHELDSKQGG